MLERPAAISTGYAHCVIDVETQSSANLPKVGASRYAADPTTTVLVVGFAIDNEPVELWYPGQAPSPDRLVEVAADPEVPFIAHNAPFEIEIARKILTPRYGLPEIALERWVCTMTTASALAMPPDLEKLALALGLQAQKDPVGKRLMKRMSRPARGVAAAPAREILRVPQKRDSACE
jgi:DNA polymerase bacteriophage-type